VMWETGSKHEVVMHVFYRRSLVISQQH